MNICVCVIDVINFILQCDSVNIPYICLFTLQRLPNGSIDAHDDGSRVSELQELLDRTNKELAQSRDHSASLGTRVTELEAELANAHRELIRSEELSIKQQREQREVRLKRMCFSYFSDLELFNLKVNNLYDSAANITHVNTLLHHC